MRLTKNEINRILETLPVGFYAKTKINVECIEGLQSYYDESSEKIVVGVDTINLGLKKVSEDFDTSVAVRTVFYHEVSHLILTPYTLIKNASYYSRELLNRIYLITKQHIEENIAFDLINIAEDERIESALRNYYINTDFRWFVTQQYSGDPLIDPKDIFYAAVRFRIGSENILKAVSDLVIKYKKFTRNNSSIACEDNWYSIGDYMADIANLYALCIAESENQKKDNQNNNIEYNKDISNPQEDRQSEQTEPDESQSNIYNNKDNKLNNDQNDTSSVENDEANNGDGHGSGRKYSELNSEEQLSPEDAEKLFSDIFDGLKNTKMINEFRRIFKQFKTRGNVGGHTNAYSGVINPRNIGNKDYKYFTRTNTENNGGAGKLHLNLWIDCSGSYSSNEKVTNQIIKALEIVERENRVFSFDVMDINMGVHIHDKNNRYIRTGGGNYLSYEMHEKFITMQKPDARNYNIVLYDGMAYRSGEHKLFSAWNHDNVYIISDTDNEKPIRANCKKAKTLFVHQYYDKTYARILEEKIYNILRAGFGA